MIYPNKNPVKLVTIITAVPILGAAVFIVGLGLAISSDVSDRYSQETFEAWSRANPTVHISKDDWDRLVRQNMLPQQPQQAVQ